MLTKTKSKPIIKPKALSTGAKVGLVCPAGRPESPAVVARCERLVRQWGFEPVVGEHVLSVHGYMAGADEQRVQDLTRFINDESIAGIFCVAGGYGSLRILRQLDYDRIAQGAKLFLGSDDNTCLLNAIFQRTGLITFHGPNLGEIASKQAFETIRSAVTLKAPLPVLSPLAADTHPAVDGREFFTCVEATAEGRLVGGNLTAYASLLGSGYQPESRGSILFLEDFDEQHGILDRWFTSLYLNGDLQYANAVILGSFEKCSGRHTATMLSVFDTFADRLKYLRKASCFGIPFGHHDSTNVIPIGVNARINTGSGELEFLEPALI